MVDTWVCIGTYNTATHECKGTFINYPDSPKSPK